MGNYHSAMGDANTVVVHRDGQCTDPFSPVIPPQLNGLISVQDYQAVIEIVNTHYNSQIKVSLSIVALVFLCIIIGSAGVGIMFLFFCCLFPILVGYTIWWYQEKKRLEQDISQTYFNGGFEWIKHGKRLIFLRISITALRNKVNQQGGVALNVHPAQQPMPVAPGGYQPQPQYGQPPPGVGYNAPPQGGGYAPQPVYGQQQPAFVPQQQPGYIPPQQQPGYAPQPAGYGQPQSNMGYGAPQAQPGYGAPPPQVYPPQNQPQYGGPVHVNPPATTGSNLQQEGPPPSYNDSMR